MVFRSLLWPISWLHIVFLFFRHVFYTVSLLPSKKGVVRTFVIGNVKMGGTGKSPVTIKVLNTMQNLNLRVAFLSRGYGRISKGFQLIQSQSTPSEVGDEPLMIAQCFPNITAAVSENRLNGIEQLMHHDSTLQWIVLDDAFQHRKLVPDCSLLLTKFDDLYVNDFVFPVGGLRDLQFRAQLANAVGVTHVPLEQCTEKTANVLREKLRLKVSQKIILFHVDYETPKPVSGHFQWQNTAPSYLFAGLANNTTFFQKGMQLSRAVVCKSFPDHHNYSQMDLDQIIHEWRNFDANQNQILTTEKDAVKVQYILKEKEIPIFYLPLKMEVGFGKQDLIDLITMTTRV
ncbi:MAG: tetraacyldisaccharide 4'-kinase [Bacteroidetes bacterium]|nr:tetraacyldisaccharide 4'-kinase [Bacteroidota bacterium]